MRSHIIYLLYNLSSIAIISCLSPISLILNANEPDGIQTGLIPLTRDKFREVLGDTRSGCHSILRDNEGLQPQKAVDAMVKFLFAKWYDEQATIDLVKQTGESRAYVFSVSNETDPERLLVPIHIFCKVLA
jgi:type I restriction enzyme M protein